LLQGGVAPSAIVLLTFTRTAVRELRDRIAGLSSEGLDPLGVHVITLDSFAWSLRKRMVEPNARLSGAGYEENFRRLNELLAGGGGPMERERVHEYLGSKQHVMVDESQDLVGVRAEFTELLLSGLPGSCGWTVFIDPAQAIYDWSESDTGEARGAAFIDRVRALKGLKALSLGTTHRTDNGPLLQLQAKARAIVLGPDGKDRCERVRALLLDGAFAIGKTVSVETLLTEATRDFNDSATRFVLFRRRGDALMLSGALVGAGVQHRLRLGHLRGSVPGWIATLSAQIDDDRWTEQGFASAWDSAVAANPDRVQRHTPEEAWKALRSIGREGRSGVDRRKVADAIAMRLLPDELAPREVGRTGPVIGTTHASKGREADEVVLVVPRGRGDRDDPDEGARVLYVGLTRPRKTLRVVAGTGRGLFSYTPLGRAWRFAGRNGNIQIEVGREGDVHPAGSLLAVPDPTATQKALLAFDGEARPVEAFTQKEDPDLRGGDGWRLNLRCLDGDKTPLGSLARGLHEDAYNATRGSWRRGPTLYRYASLLDVSTVGITEEDPLRARLPEPWRSARLWLAPVVAGLFVGFKPNR
jgi:hypothetical protein